ncbi:PepSY-associated TM helix domain-containing protein [Ideonella oryzae]|uniref:PepSY-associated TM helix domain-containing protein n=1 Tax=Ideonella oryzae TaxID=2937441 RepID=A0ABT1BMK5_9BURK|nr:PepSY-associated TM helix domain-containing protein [Ideonella oryzae]
MSAHGFKTLLRWHWISSALCLIGMLGFAITGFTLNHAADIEAQPVLTRWQATLPAPVLAAVQAAQPAREGGDAPMPAALRQWVAESHGLRLPAGLAPEWSAEEFYLALPRPGGDAWLRVDLSSGESEFEDSDRGLLALLNDLHKGRHTGAVWRAFLDVFAAGCLVFCITGLLILHRHAGQRALTWPLTAAGFVLPALLVLLFIH